jgi:hypothetical protein
MSDIDKDFLRQLIDKANETIIELEKKPNSDWSEDVIFVMNGDNLYEKRTNEEIITDPVQLFLNGEKHVETRPRYMPEIFKGKDITLVKWNHGWIAGPKVISLNPSETEKDPKTRAINAYAVIEINTFCGLGEGSELKSLGKAEITNDFEKIGKINFVGSVEFKKDSQEDMRIKCEETNKECIMIDNQEYKTGFPFPNERTQALETIKKLENSQDSSDKEALKKAQALVKAQAFGYYIEKETGVKTTTTGGADDSVFVQYADPTDVQNSFYGSGSFHVRILRTAYNDIYEAYTKAKIDAGVKNDAGAKNAGARLRKSKKRSVKRKSKHKKRRSERKR